MEQMEDISSQIREVELVRRRLLFTEYPFPRQCRRCCYCGVVVYFCVAALICINYGLSFDSDTTTVDLSLSTSSSRRRMQASTWQEVDWTESLFDDTCAFVP